MRKLSVFNQVTLDGYFAGVNGDISWAHRQKEDAAWSAFVSGNASAQGQLLFGRITYELMTKYWPTPLAKENDPIVADGMNRMPKVVFSRTLNTATWSNTTLVKTDMAAAVRRMKTEPGSDMVILGSGSIVSQLTQERLIDEYQIVVLPSVLGKGRTMFDGVSDTLNLSLTSTRRFDNGNVVLCYEPTN
jgi:dihydrofolate reductase